VGVGKLPQRVAQRKRQREQERESEREKKSPGIGLLMSISHKASASALSKVSAQLLDLKLAAARSFSVFRLLSRSL